MFSTLLKTKIIILSIFMLLSASAFNAGQSKSLLFGKELMTFREKPFENKGKKNQRKYWLLGKILVTSEFYPF